ncbi:MAG: hypothetical protein GC185_00970 [Alphaproteobacteria bacterium]|nr:hypothetical protein [Alphaproteobacteria bacterium]
MNTRRAFALYALNRRWSNAALLRHRNFDGHIVSMQQSGSHWLKNMLSHVLADVHGLPPVGHIQDDSIIGGIKSPPVHDNIPRIVHSHSMPHALTLKLPFLRYPGYIVLLRDLRHSLVSHYERFNALYGGVDFSTYLRGDVRQKTFFSDIWTRIRFMNEWGRLARQYPGRVALLRYEDMREDAAAAVTKACRFFRIEGAGPEVVRRAVGDCGKAKMAERQNPAMENTVVRLGERPPLSSYFTQENEAFFRRTCREYLTEDMGYGYLSDGKARA